MDDVRVTDSSIERLYREEGDRLWWALVAYVGDREIASDAVAEAFARALSNVEGIRDPSAWVWRVAFRVATVESKAARQLGTYTLDTFDHVDETGADVILAIQRLPDKQRAAVSLYYLEDLSTREIARLLGMAVPTVSVHLHRARKRLRAILEVEDA